MIGTGLSSFLFTKEPKNNLMMRRTGLYPCSTKTRDGLGNPSPTPKISRDPRDFPRAKPEGNLEGRGKSREISRGHGFCTPRPEGFPEGEARGKSRGSRGAKPMTKGNLEGGGDGFPNPSRVLVEHKHSLIITREGLILTLTI